MGVTHSKFRNPLKRIWIMKVTFICSSIYKDITSRATFSSVITSITLTSSNFLAWSIIHVIIKPQKSIIILIALSFIILIHIIIIIIITMIPTILLETLWLCPNHISDYPSFLPHNLYGLLILSSFN